MNIPAVRVIFEREMARFFRTIIESLISPVISTALYFVVFGAAIGDRIETIGGVSYGAFIVPGLIMLTVMTQSVSNASFSIFFPKYIRTIDELLSAPVSYVEIVLGYVGAATVKSVLIGGVILATSYAFVDLPIRHPGTMILFLVLTSFSFSLFGFIIGIWAADFQQLQIVPLLVLTPLIFLGGSFYSIDMLPPLWIGQEVCGIRRWRQHAAAQRRLGKPAKRHGEHRRHSQENDRQRRHARQGPLL